MSAPEEGAAAAPPLLEARNLHFGYAGGPPVFENVSLDIAEREIVCLLGGSGCGKSTLLRQLGRLEKPDGRRSGGDVRFGGKPLDAPHPRTALVFQ